MQKKDLNSSFVDVKDVLSDVGSEPGSPKAVSMEYRDIFDKLESLRMQRKADVRLVKTSKDGLSVWGRFVESAKKVAQQVDGYARLSPITATAGMVQTRGIDSRQNGTGDKEFVFEKAVTGGTIRMVILEHSGQQEFGLRLWVESLDGSRLGSFLCTIIDQENGQPFFTDKQPISMKRWG
jgi:hypothetical protein